MEDYRLEQTGQEVQRILNGAAMEANLQAEVERATDAEGTLQDNIDAEAQARQDADGLLQQAIDDEAQRAKDAEEANAGEIDGIKALIPSTASEGNKLADTNFVNSSIQTATAEYRGDYNVVTDLHLAIDATHAQIETLLPTVIAEADKNDYCYVMIPTSAQTPTEIAKIERYKMTSDGWKFEYDVNNSTFTAEEWAAIKSGITSGLVAKLNSLPTNSDLLLLLAAKQDVLTFDSVPVPESNNPVKSGGVYSAIDDEKTARLNSDTAIHSELDGLQAKVPATASSDNKLVDQNQMNSSISTATATFRGDWNVVSDLHLATDATRAQIAALLPTVISTADNNDYCYVEIPTSAETPAQIERVERFKYNGTAWGYEYVLNNSGFTAAQWAAINSMITSGLVAKLSALPTNADLLAMLAQKQDNLTFDTTPTENSTNPVTSGGVFAADKALSDAIEAILLLIPSAASSLNKLVDTSLMNSSISTATATFRGTYNLVSDLGLGIDATEGQIAAALSTAISTADNNDYSFVQIPTSAQTPAQIARTDRYKFNGTAWAFEYTLNTSGFTAAQWAAINSTITSALVSKLNALPTEAELQEALSVLTSGITAINQKIPSTASQSNKLVDASTMESYIAQVINILDASFNVTSTDGHITLHITQVDGVITSVQVQGSDIASAANLTLVTNRVTTAEGNISGLTTRMGTAETNIANLQQLYNNLQQSKPVPVTSLPTSGQQQGVIYRLSGSTSYSDYMWNGSSWVLMATYDNAIDNTPTKDSNNLVKSGGVYAAIKQTNDELRYVPTYCLGDSSVTINNRRVNVSGKSIGDVLETTYISGGKLMKVPVFNGKKITLKFKGTYYSRPYERGWVLTDTTNHILSWCDESTPDYSVNPLELTPVSDGYIYVSVQPANVQNGAEVGVYMDMQQVLDKKINYNQAYTLDDTSVTSNNRRVNVSGKSIGDELGTAYANGEKLMKVPVYGGKGVTLKFKGGSYNLPYQRGWVLTDTTNHILSWCEVSNPDYSVTPLKLLPISDGYLYVSVLADYVQYGAEVNVLTYNDVQGVIDAKVLNLQNQIDGCEKKSEFDILIPDVVYAIVGTEFNIWNDTVSLSMDRGLESPLNYQVEWLSNIGTVRDRCFRFIPDTVGDYQVTCVIYDSSNIEKNRKTFTIKVKAKNALSSVKRTVFFGDSLGANTAQKLYEDFNDATRFTGTAPLLLGSMGSDGCKYEAVGGYTWWDFATEGRISWHVNVSGVSSIELNAVYKDTNDNEFIVKEINIISGTGNIMLTRNTGNTNDLVIPSGTLTKISGEGDNTIPYTGGVKNQGNPLWNNGGLDFENYRTQILGLDAAVKLDAVFFQLGVNDNYNVDGIKTYITNLYDAFIADNPSGKFVIGLEPPSCNTHIIYSLPLNDLSLYHKKMYEFSIMYMSLLSDNTRPNIRLSTQRFNVDRYYGYPLLTSQYISDRYRETAPIHGNFAHPSESGYYQIADALLADYVGILSE